MRQRCLFILICLFLSSCSDQTSHKVESNEVVDETSNAVMTSNTAPMVPDQKSKLDFIPSSPSPLQSISVSPIALEKSDIRLGELPQNRRGSDKQAIGNTEAKRTALFQEKFNVESELEIISVSANTISEVGFNLALFAGNEPEESESPLRSIRSSTLQVKPAKIEYLSLKPGIYLAIAKSDQPADMVINIEKLSAPEINISETGSVKQPISVPPDVSGDFKSEIFYLKPKNLDQNKLYTAKLLFAEGTGQLIYTGADGKWLTRETGVSPLTISGILGKDLANNLLGVNFQSSAKKIPDGKWRLIVEPSENQKMLPEVGSNVLEASELESEAIVAGWLDKSDKDTIQFSDQSLDSNQQYYLKYKGPVATAEVQRDNATYRLYGRDLKLGPFGKEAINLSLSGAKYAGEYSITKQVVRNKGKVVTEPDADIANQFEAKDRVSGELSASNDADILTFELGDVAQMWRVMILGDSITRLAVSSPFEELIRVARPGSDKSRRLKVPDLYMGPGPVKLNLSGGAGKYKVFLKPLGPPRPNEEREPNHGNFYRTIEFDQEYIGVLSEGDTDQYVFFLEKPMTIAANFNLPPGATSTVSFSANGGSNLLNKSLNQNTEAFDVELPAGEILVSLRPSVPSPAEYNLKFNYKPFEDLTLKQVNSPAQNLNSISEIKSLEDIQSFSLFSQSIALPDISGLGDSEELQLWTPSTKVSLDKAQANYRLSIEPDFETGTTPIWIAKLEQDQIKSISQYQINARPDATAVNPTRVNKIPTSMIGGLNVAWAPLGATWMEQPGFEIDEQGYLPKYNGARAASLFALNDGIRPLAGEGNYTTTLSKVANEIYTPILDLPGDNPIPLVGVAITNRVATNNHLNRFAVDLSMDGITWETVLESNVESWTKRQFFEFSVEDATAKFVRLRTFQDNEKDSSILLTEFEVIAKPGLSGLPGIMITDDNLGAAGRVVGGGFARSFKEGLFEKVGTTNRGRQRKSGWTELGKTFSFKNQGIAEIEKIFVAHGTSESSYKVPKFIKLRGSVNGPAGPFDTEIELELPADFSPGKEAFIDLPERLVANAVNIEFSTGEEKAQQVVIPYVRLIERPESTEYLSVLGTAEEFSARPYEFDAQDTVQATPYEGELMPLTMDSSLFSGNVELDKNTNTWLVKPSDGENTLELLVDGEPGFSPDIVVRKAGDESEEESPPLDKKTNPLTGQETWVFDLPSDGLEVTVSEPPRSTIFLMDQSPSAVAYISRARRAVMNYADTMIQGKDRLLLRALGRAWSNEQWMSDPVKIRKNLLKYQTGGNSDGEGSLLGAAERLSDVTGLRSVVILTDGDVAPKAGLTKALAEHNIRVFVIKLSSAKMWGDPFQSIKVAQQWTELTQGELAYVFRTQDITTAYERISTRLLGPKAYTISANGSTRMIAPGTLTVTQTGENKASNQNSTLYHVLFDASGSMLKRTGNTRRINTAKKAITKFVNETLTDEQKIGLRVFGGEPDKCETELRLSPTDGSIKEFVEQIESIRPKSYARTPIAQSLAALKEDLKGIDQKVQVIVLSDGEETCKGEAGLVIDSLIADGTADRVDIVSFQLGDNIDRSNFKDWAKRGNGVYIDAQSGEELTEAFTQTVEQSYEVIKDGVTITTGIVGGVAIKLSPGTYDVKLNDTVKSVTIETGSGANLVF